MSISTVQVAAIPNLSDVERHSDNLEDELLQKDGSKNHDSSAFVNLTYIEENRIETFTINMPQLNGREKSIIAYLPADYSSSNKSYPVLYLLNAEEVFTYYSFEDDYWLMNESLYQFYTSDFNGEVIIIGAVTDPIYKWNEYSPWINKNMYLWMDPYDANRVEGGEGQAYLEFLINTLKPEIDNRYRTLPDQESTSIGGYTMGGLFSLYAGLTRPDVFSKVIALSPSIWFAEVGGTWLSNNHLIQLIKTNGVPKGVSLKIDVAEKERTTDIEIRPAVNDEEGKKITFPQAYLEGTRAVVLALVEGGLPLTAFKGEAQDSIEWINEFFEPVNQLERSEYIYFFPIIHTPKFSPRITSPAATTFFIGHNNEFTITAIGGPVPIITTSTNLPTGISFIDNGDGTATLSGEPTGPEGVFQIVIKANNGITPAAVQYFDLRIAKEARCQNDNSCILSFDISMAPYLNRSRRVWVYLPPNYNTSGDRYQVIYLTNAQHEFGSQTGSYIEDMKDWNIDEKLDLFYETYGIGTIVVALEFDSYYPWDEFTPWTNNNMDNWLKETTIVTGKGVTYLSFITNILKPIVDSSYRTKPERRFTAIGGGSRHALFALYAGLTRPDIFSKVMAMSPAVWLAEGGNQLPLGYPRWLKTNQLKEWLDDNNAPTNVKFFLYIGTNEHTGPAEPYPYAYWTNGTDVTMQQVYKTGADYVKIRLSVDSVPFRYTVNVGGTHYPLVWREYIDDALHYLEFYPQ